MHVEKEQNDVKKGEKEEYLAQGSVGNEERKEKGEVRLEVDEVECAIRVAVSSFPTLSHLSERRESVRNEETITRISMSTEKWVVPWEKYHAQQGKAGLYFTQNSRH